MGKVFDMIEETLVAVQAKMERESLEAETSLHDAAVEVEQLRPAVSVAEAVLKDRSAQVSMWVELLEKDKHAFELAKGDLTEAERNQMCVNQKIDQVEQTKAV